MGFENVTISTIFLVPTLKIDREKLKENNFVNAYVVDSTKEVQYEDALYLLFKPPNLDKFKKFLDEEYERTPDLIDEYDYNHDHIVLVYVLRDKWQDDIALIKQGRYSKVSNAFKEIFPKKISITHGNSYKEDISLQWRIFQKDLKLKEYWENKLDHIFTEDLEVWWGWNIEKETMDLTKLT